jgi:AraC family transcriptional regulator
MKLFIKNMVCNRCIMVVREQFEKAGIKPIQVNMGEVELQKPLTEAQLEDLSLKLSGSGFEILDDKRQKQIETIKKHLIEKVQSGQIEEHFSITDFLSNKIHKEYSQISRLFSEVEGLTIEQFFILQKIEKVKEWLVYDELSLSEIAWKLGYSSVAHLSAQFKKVTGMTPSEFKKLGASHRKSLDQI